MPRQNYSTQKPLSNQEILIGGFLFCLAFKNLVSFQGNY